MKLKFIIMLFGLLLTFSCNTRENYKTQAMTKLKIESMTEDPKEYASIIDYASVKEIYKNGSQNNKKYTKSGYIKFKNNDLDFSKHILDSLLKLYNGLIVTEKFEKNYYATYNFVTSIPNKNFDNVILYLKKIFGNPESISMELEDFTKSYYDNESRLKSKKAYLEKCLDLLKKATKIKDILDIEEKVSVVQEEIDEYASTIKNYDYLNDNYTLTVEFITDATKKDSKDLSIITKVYQAFVSGWNLGIETVYFLISKWPFVLLLGILSSIYIVFKRRRKLSN